MGIFNKGTKAEEEMKMAMTLFEITEKPIRTGFSVFVIKNGYRYENDELHISWADNQLDVTYTLNNAVWQGETLDRFFMEGYNSESLVTKLSPRSLDGKGCAAFTISGEAICREKEVFDSLTQFYLDIFELNWGPVEALADRCNRATYGETRKVK